MFQSATPEQLKKISEQMKENGCTDVVDWMQKTKWYMQFDYGQYINKKLNRDMGMER